MRPEAVPSRHRRGCRLFWRRQSTPRSRPAPLATAPIAPIRQLARDNPPWGAERIRGALLKLTTRAHEIWACDAQRATDLVVRTLFAFFRMAHGSRRVVHIGVTRYPTDAWAAQQFRYLIRDNHSTYGRAFARLQR